jgi:hypothetical protein
MNSHPPTGGSGPADPGDPGPGNSHLGDWWHGGPGSGDPGPGNPGPSAAPGDHRPLRRNVAIAALVVAVMVVAALVTAARDSAAGRSATSRAVSVTAAPAATVDFQGTPGLVRIVAADTGQVRLTGQLDWKRHAPVVVDRRTDHGHVLTLSYRCAASSPCTGTYRLVVPRHTAIVLRQPSGHVIVSGLAGSLRITARSVDISATGLRSPSLVATITSGHLGATFVTPPRQLGITLTSAQATVWLPAGAGYAVTQQVTAGYVHVGIPQDASATRTVTATISSGELELLNR